MSKRQLFTEALGVLNILVLLMAMAWSIFIFGGSQANGRPALWEILGVMSLMVSPYYFGALTTWSVLDDHTWGLRSMVLLNALFVVASIDPILHSIQSGRFYSVEPTFLILGGPVCILNCMLMMYRLSQNKA